MSKKTIILACLLTCLVTTDIVAQNAPTVVTDPRFARGATMAFGRIKSVNVNGVAISKRGFCLSESPEPSIDDIVSTKQLTNNNSIIYYFEDLKPATKYYMRAYATNKNGETGYGEVIKFYTIPMGAITYWYNNGGDDATNKRINDAAKQACDIFSNLTCIKKQFDIGYSPGTPTADCGYKDQPWINMGANTSYQRTGTIMHEMQHGLGLIPYSTQWNKNILRERLDGEGRGSGHWLGDRVSAFLDFWDNTTGSQLNGDFQHMWPYGINGAQEDNGTLVLYYGNAMIAQALGEDGLEHRYSTFADPCYIFDQEDDIKYYLKNESTERGLYDSYLIPTSNGLLKWRKMTSAEAQANDSTAWYITFTPENQYYQLRNAATGQYLTYNSGFKTMARATLTANDNFHLMRGRINVGTGADAKRGYWLIHPTGDWTPKCLQANANGVTAQANFNIANTATAQRWLILTADEMEKTEQSFMAQLKAEASDLLAKVVPLLSVPHYENTAGADETFAQAIATLEQAIEESTTPGELTSLTSNFNQSVTDFLSSVTAIMKSKPFDLTFLINSPRMTSTDGWTGDTPTLNYSAGEFYEKTFNFSQTINNLPIGNYNFCVQGFQRPGKTADVYKAYTEGTDNITTYVFAGSASQKLKNICVDAQTRRLGGTEVAVATNLYVPNNMQAASKYFAKGLYENCLPVTLRQKGSLRLGLRCTKSESNFWTIFDNFRLHFYGKPVQGDLNGDSIVSVADIIVIARFIGGSDSERSTEDCDVNGDGEVNADDIAAVAAIIVGN